MLRCIRDNDIQGISDSPQGYDVQSKIYFLLNCNIDCFMFLIKDINYINDIVDMRTLLMCLIKMDFDFNCIAQLIEIKCLDVDFKELIQIIILDSFVIPKPLHSKLLELIFDTYDIPKDLVEELIFENSNNHHIVNVITKYIDFYPSAYLFKSILTGVRTNDTKHTSTPDHTPGPDDTSYHPKKLEGVDKSIIRLLKYIFKHYEINNIFELFSLDEEDEYSSLFPSVDCEEILKLFLRYPKIIEYLHMVTQLDLSFDNGYLIWTAIEDKMYDSLLILMSSNSVESYLIHNRDRLTDIFNSMKPKSTECCLRQHSSNVTSMIQALEAISCYINPKPYSNVEYDLAIMQIHNDDITSDIIDALLDSMFTIKIETTINKRRRSLTDAIIIDSGFGIKRKKLVRTPKTIDSIGKICFGDIISIASILDKYYSCTSPINTKQRQFIYYRQEIIEGHQLEHLNLNDLLTCGEYLLFLYIKYTSEDNDNYDLSIIEDEDIRNIIYNSLH